MNKHNGELISMVRALIEKMTNGRENNEHNVRNIETSLRSDSFDDIIFKWYMACSVDIV